MAWVISSKSIATHLMRAMRRFSDSLESNGAIERITFWRVGAQMQFRERLIRVGQQYCDEIEADAAAAIGATHVQMPKAANRKIAGVRVDIQPADADHCVTVVRREQNLAGAFEPVCPIAPLTDESINESKSIRAGFTRERLDRSQVEIADLADRQVELAG